MPKKKKTTGTVQYADRRPSRVAAAIAGEVWAIRPEVLEAICEVINLRLSGQRFTQDEITARIGHAEQNEDEGVQVSDGVALINVFGVLEKRMNLFSRISGGTSYEKMKQQVAEAINSNGVSTIVLNVDSPGGSVQGAIEVSDFIFEARARKRIVAIANENANSAAYLIASAAREVVVTPTAMSGSIGALLVTQEFSEREKQEGIKTTILHAGALKKAQNPHLKMTEQEKDYLQDRVDTAFGVFASSIARNRGMSLSAIEATEARVYFGEEAISVGLADSVSTIDDLLQRERRRAQRMSA